MRMECFFDGIRLCNYWREGSTQESAIDSIQHSCKVIKLFGNDLFEKYRSGYIPKGKDEIDEHARKVKAIHDCDLPEWDVEPIQID